LVQVARRTLALVGLEPLLGVLRQHPPEALHLERLACDGPPSARPRISVVTPSRNQARFVARTLESVLDQGYPDLEYVVIDGASTDGSREEIARFGPRLTHWISEPDRGQAEALNKGFRRTTGDIMGYLNSDDLLLPGTLDAVARAFAEHPGVDILYGHRILIDEDGQAIGRWILPSHSRSAYAFGDFIPQETMFWRRAIWERAGGRLDESFRFALDWDLIARFDALGARFLRLPRFMAAFRVHAEQKTSMHMASIGAEEGERILRKLHPRRRRVLPLERTLRLIPYVSRHLLQDARDRHTYLNLIR
jgi:glycosyltransferase involved in cell wall biosynthesis